MEFLEKLSLMGEASKAYARAVWEQVQHLWECEQEASSSGLESEEKTHAVVTGILTELDSHCIMFDDIFGVAITRYKNDEAQLVIPPVIPMEDEDRAEENRLAMVAYSPPDIDIASSRLASPTNLFIATDLPITRQEFNELKDTLN